MTEPEGKSRRAGRPEAPIDPDAPAAELASELRTLRSESGMSLREVARRVGVSPSTVSRINGGGHTPRWELVERVLQVLGRDKAEDMERMHHIWRASRPDPLARPGSTAFDVARLAAFRAGVPARELSDEEYLREERFLDEQGRLTRDGELLFGLDPLAAVPSAMVRCAHFHGVTKLAPMDRTDVVGSVPDQITTVLVYLAARASGYPMIALREIIVNALVHRDYDDHLSCVHVRVFDDRIEVSSPGGWIGREPEGVAGVVGIGTLASEARHRNFALARALGWIGLIEGVGAGIPRCVADCRKRGVPEPTVTQRDGFTIVTIRAGQMTGK